MTGRLDRPRSGHTHRILHLADAIRVPGEDWRVRQHEHDRLLESVAHAAKDQSIALPTEGVDLAVRISFSDDGEQLGFALATAFLREWAYLGGVLFIDN
ncbi:hypothetical protein [Agromyces cerinus]|uniref:hypothetical protein n=1 Tax=Agromyces cerinus TaxID=33878 RepID=UPI00117834D2|nr:hypothetical protein [Agromyces cerinus]